MNNKLAPLIEKTQSSFWFVPSLMILFSFLLAAVTLYIDLTYSQENKGAISFLYATNVEAVRSLLATIAGAMITVTSIAFSITIVALTLASSQFGPRLMRNFMMDKGTQIVLGTFISTFLFCIVIFCALSFKAPYAFEPGVTIAVAILMTCFSVCTLVYFIHHVAMSIQADVVIDDVYCELQGNIAKLFPALSKEKSPQPDSLFTQRKDKNREISVYAPFSGYLQLIDKKSLLTLAEQSHCVIELHFSAGDFIVENTIIATVHLSNKTESGSSDAISKSIIGHTVYGSCRTPVQDPYTAITCIDKLNAVLCRLTTKVFPETEVLVDGVVRLICKSLTFTDIATAAFDQIRQQSVNNLAVTIKMLDALHVLSGQTTTDEQHNFVLTQTEMISQQQAKECMSDHDRGELMQRIEKITI